MYNDTIYNVIIAPHIEDKLFKKRYDFTRWLWGGVILLFFDIGYLVYGLINQYNELDWIYTVISVMGIVFVSLGFYVMFHNPLRKYHISLQVYLYLLFMDYFYFKNEKYPNGLKVKMQYVIIVQSCIDSIDKYIKMMEILLISGDNTIARIKYLLALRNLLYKMKGEEFFKNKIVLFRSVLDNFYASTHIGLKAVIDFNENVEYFEDSNLELRIQECNNILIQNEASLENNSSQKDDKISGRKRNMLIVLVISLIVTIASLKIPDRIWAIVIINISVIADMVTVFWSSRDSK